MRRDAWYVVLTPESSPLLIHAFIAYDALNEQYPPPHVPPEIFYDHDATPESNRDTHSGERGSGMCQWAYTVSPGLSVRPEMTPTSISGPAEPRLTARSDPSLADGEELAGLDSTVALMPSFCDVSPELPPRCRSGGISSPTEFTDGTLGEQIVSSEEDDGETGSTGEFTGVTRFANSIRSPPSPAIPARVNLLLDALEPILANYTSPLSPEEATLAHPSSTVSHLENPPRQYPPSSADHSLASRPATPEYDGWSTETITPRRFRSIRSSLRIDSDKGR